MGDDKPVGVVDLLALHDATSGCQSCASLRHALAAATERAERLESDKRQLASDLVMERHRAALLDVERNEVTERAERAERDLATVRALADEMRNDIAGNAWRDDCPSCGYVARRPDDSVDKHAPDCVVRRYDAAMGRR